MSQPTTIERVDRPASPPLTGAFRTTLGAAGIATVLVGGLSIANPVLAASAVAIGTGILSGVGKKARDHLAAQEAIQADQRKSRGLIGSIVDILALGFSWLG
jgi:hypothetical protein